ncbi:MAG TPA: VWA domain-containing protein [Bacteroidia bacterium]|jgi:Ca-activated chloride channel family protein|nr:VWA domain-containing protein [Bacteroidia bacterium]
MFQLENKYFLVALLVIPLFIVLYGLTTRWRKRMITRYGEPDVIKKLIPNVSVNKRTAKFILFLVAFGLLIIGIVNPQIGTRLENVKRTGADLMICLDVSNSMRATDLSPNRLDKAKMAISKLIDKLNGDRIGIIIFAGEAYVQLPITTDYASSKLFLESISPEMIPTQGTNIGAAIDLSMESFGKDEGKNKAIIVITDGEDNESAGITAAQRAAEKGVSIFTIGMGSVDGAPIPIYVGGVREGYKKDKDGNTIVTRLNQQTLQDIASAGNGIFVRATNSDAGLTNILNEIDKLEKKQFESKMYSDYEDQFQLFIFIAFLFLLAEIFISERKSKLVKRLKLFENEK